MPQEPSENTQALRSEFAAQLSKAIAKMSRKAAAEKLKVTRQMLGLYLKGKATPGAEVIKRACDEWHLSLSVRGFEFSGGAFGEGTKRRTPRERAVQLDLLELLEKLRNDQLEAKIVGREGDSFYLELRIKVVA
jgi:transcriptional regulator with XRE-family HTH domain